MAVSLILNRGEKVKDVLDLMESFKERPIDKDMLQQVLKIQQLVKELNN